MAMLNNQMVKRKYQHNGAYGIVIQAHVFTLFHYVGFSKGFYAFSYWLTVPKAC